MRKSYTRLLIGWLTIFCCVVTCHGQNTLSLVSYSKKFGVGYRICVDKDYVYMTNNNGVIIVDIHQPKKPKKISMIPTGVTFGIYVNNGLAYISGEHGLIIADISDPENPKKISEYYIGIETQGVKVKGSYVYLASSKGLEILDISDPNKISTIAHIGNNGMRAIELCNGIAYLAVPSIGVYVVDVTDPFSPQKITFLASTKGAWNVHIHNEYLYVARHGAGISIFNISDKKYPQLIGNFRDDDGGEAQGVWGDGKYLYVSDNYGIEVLDVTDPANPYEIDEYSKVNAAHDICSDGTLIYVASASKGLMVLKFKEE